jgi:hypothetical protein
MAKEGFPPDGIRGCRNGHERFVEQRGYIQVRVRHDTHPSAFPEKVQEDRFPFLAGTLYPSFEGFLLPHLEFEIFHFAPSSSSIIQLPII